MPCRMSQSESTRPQGLRGLDPSGGSAGADTASYPGKWDEVEVVAAKQWPRGVGGTGGGVRKKSDAQEWEEEWGELGKKEKKQGGSGGLE